MVCLRVAGEDSPATRLPMHICNLSLYLATILLLMWTDPLFTQHLARCDTSRPHRIPLRFFGPCQQGGSLLALRKIESR